MKATAKSTEIQIRMFENHLKAVLGRVGMKMPNHLSELLENITEKAYQNKRDQRSYLSVPTLGA